MYPTIVKAPSTRVVQPNHNGLYRCFRIHSHGAVAVPPDGTDRYRVVDVAVSVGVGGGRVGEFLHMRLQPRSRTVRSVRHRRLRSAVDGDEAVRGENHGRSVLHQQQYDRNAEKRLAVVAEDKQHAAIRMPNQNHRAGFLQGPREFIEEPQS